MIPLSEEIERLVRQEVAAGRAATPAAFVEAAVLRLIEAAREQAAELRRVAAEGIADIEAGRYVTVDSAEDLRVHLDGILQRAIGRGTAGT